MGQLQKVVYLTKAQYQELITNGSVTSGGVTVVYSANDLYVTPQNGAVEDVQVGGVSVVDAQGVANVPVAVNGAGDNAVLGVVKSRVGDNGIQILTGGFMATYVATDADAKAGTQSYRPIAPNRQDKAVFFGLSKLAGEDLKNDTVTVGVYPEKSKSAIHQMLDAPEAVSGTTPSITGKAGVRYICGEVSTLTIAPPASGCIDVIFTSGSTPTVLTVPATVKFPAWFDPTALDADCTYEINIMDGVYGTVMAWA